MAIVYAVLWSEAAVWVLTLAAHYQFLVAVVVVGTGGWRDGDTGRAGGWDLGGQLVGGWLGGLGRQQLAR